MVHTNLGHIQFNVRPENMAFYRDLMGYLGWQTLYDTPEMLGIMGDGGVSLWFASQVKDVANDYDGPGVNHLGFGAASQADVEAAGAFVQSKGVALLFETPRHRPDFASSADDTYYQIMFETPDRLLLEVVYTGPKQG